MAYRRKYNRKPKRKTTRKPNLKKQVLSIVNKTREVKRLFFNINEDIQLSASTYGADWSPFINYPNAQPSSLCANFVQIGDEAYNRDGNQITPNYWCFKGLLTYNCESLDSQMDTISVRVVAFHTDRSIKATTGGSLQLANGRTTSLSEQFNAIYRNWNYEDIKPFYDRTIKLAPAHFTDKSDSLITVPSYAQNRTPTSRMINIKHYYGKNPRNMTYPKNDTSNIANKNNVQVWLIIRNASNNLLSNTPGLEVKLNGEGYFAYRDC